MAYALHWMPEILKRAGLKVATVPGWQTRGLGDVGPTLGVLIHHTAGRKTGNMPSLQTLIHGRAKLRGPLAQLGLGRDGTYYVIAAGRAQHAGKGMWEGVTQGNRHFIGIETESTGLIEDPLPAVQKDALERGVAALLRHLSLPASGCAGHKEYALPRGRKIDPLFDMQEFRGKLARRLVDPSIPTPLIPGSEPAPAPGAQAGRPTLRREMSGELVAEVQGRLGAAATGYFDAVTEAIVRVFQRNRLLVPDGIVGPKTWLELDELAVRVVTAKPMRVGAPG